MLVLDVDIRDDCISVWTPRTRVGTRVWRSGGEGEMRQKFGASSRSWWQESMCAACRNITGAAGGVGDQPHCGDAKRNTAGEEGLWGCAARSS